MEYSYWVIALLGQMLGGVVMAVGVIVGLRLALPSLARALARELEAAKHAGAEDAASASGRPVVTLEPRDELRNGARSDVADATAEVPRPGPPRR